MTEPKPVRTHFNAADIDAQGNVVVWDHGPLPLPESVKPDSDEAKAHEADAKAWHDRHGDGPAPLTMHATDAGNALQVEPERYAVEPRVDDGEVEAEVAEIKKRREEAKKAAAEHAAAVQHQIDRKAAIATVLSRRNAKRAADEAEKRAADAKPRGRPFTRPIGDRRTPSPAAENAFNEE